MRTFYNAEITEAVLRGRRPFETCAVVGSSGRLLGRGFGEEIDRHEFVVRHNNAPTAGYESDVGAKTTMMVMNSIALRQLQKFDKQGDLECPQNHSVFYTSRDASLRRWLGQRCANETDPGNFIDVRDYINTEALGTSQCIVWTSSRGGLIDDAEGGVLLVVERFFSD